MMRVLHVVPSLGPAYGGLSKAVRDLALALAREGVRVDVASTRDADKGEALDGVRTHLFAAQRRSGSYMFSWPLTEWLWRHQREYDLVHVHSIFSYPTLVASRIARRLNQPYVVAPHGMVEPWCLQYKAWKKQPYMRLVEHRTLSVSAALHALVIEEERNLRALRLAAPTFVLPNGIHLDEFSTLPSRAVFEQRYPEVKGKRIVLFMGRVDPKKGLDLLVKALAEIVRDPVQAPLCLVIAGPDLVGYRAEIERMIEAEGIGQHVIWTGMVTGEMKLATLSAADVFVLASRSEGFSVAILEALAVGCPVVITEACNFSKVAEVQAGALIGMDAGQLTQALRNILSNERQRRAMGQRGMRLVHAEFGWQVIGRRMREVYEDILRCRQQSAAWTKTVGAELVPARH